MHGPTGALFLTVIGILLANTTLDLWWVVAIFAPLAVFSFLGWAYEGWIIVRGTADLRRGEDKAESK
jgi:hypothetical protein